MWWAIDIKMAWANYVVLVGYFIWLVGILARSVSMTWTDGLILIGYSFCLITVVVLLLWDERRGYKQ